MDFDAQPDPFGLSVVVPALNEEGNIKELVERIDRALRSQAIEYEIIVVDDYSTDATAFVALALSDRYPVSVHQKKGRPGKAFSLLEGFSSATYSLVAMIDADLQYMPETLPAMVAQIQAGRDVVVANRIDQTAASSRKVASQGFAFIFGRLLHGLACDVQSGLKVFRREILRDIQVQPSPWTFDLEFLIKARHAGYRLGTVDMDFHDRRSGQSKIHVLRASWEIGLNALKLRMRSHPPIRIQPRAGQTMLGAGFGYRRQRFITHTTLPSAISAISTFTALQKAGLAALVAAGAVGFTSSPLTTGIVAVAVLSIVYFLDVIFQLWLIIKSLGHPPELDFSPAQLASVNQTDLPRYTILCPLFKEAEVLPSFLDAMSQLDWPPEKLEVLLLLEANDHETIQAVEAAALPSFVRAVIVPHSLPKTKPKACNYGLALATGEYLVVYDAEDIPERSQLKKAYLGFQQVPRRVKCLQAKLSYFNPNQNLLTRLFTAEYALWFDIILTGLQSIHTAIPLGGTSNHFRTEDLRQLQGWDPFNVTEDCDLGVRLFKQGYQTAIIDSTTLEEANSNLRNWLRQRSRWIKGYMQTYLVHMRQPGRFIKDHGWHAFVFQLTVGGKVAFLLINPILWLATISYFALHAVVGPSIELLYPPVIFYVAGFSLVFGNFLYLYFYMIGCAKRGQWGLIKYVFFVPVYWLLGSAAAVMALFQLLIKPHYWEKTHHGLHLKKPKPVKARPMEELEPRLAPGPEPAQPRPWKKVFKGGGMFVMAVMLANFLNFVFNVYVGRNLSFGELGLVIIVNTLWLVAAVALNAVFTTVNRQTAYLSTAADTAASVTFLRATLRKTLMLSGAASLVWLLGVPGLTQFFHISHAWALYWFTPVFVFGVMSAAVGGFLQGTLHYRALVAVLLIEPISKLVAAVGFQLTGRTELTYLAVPISIVAAGSVAGWWMWRRWAAPKDLPARTETFPGFFFGVAVMVGMSTTIFLTLDILLAKHFLTPEQAGVFGLLALVGKMIFFLGALPGAFMVSFVSRDLGQNRDPSHTFHKLFLATAVLAGAGFICLGPFGRLTVPILFGAKTAAIVPLLQTYAFAITLFTLANAISLYHLARKQYVYPIVTFVFSGLMAVIVFLRHTGIEQLVETIQWVSLAMFAAMVGLHVLEKDLPFMHRNVADLLGAFRRLPGRRAQAPAPKRILVFNWRDTNHVLAGGAEVYIQGMAKHWVAQGCQVTIFCGSDGRAPRNEIIDGVQIIRRGGFYFVYLWAFVYYWLQFRGQYDVIVDCQNGVPFFTPLYVREPVFCLMHHVHQEVFRRSLPPPLAWIATTLEKDVMPVVYRQTRFITVSESSVHDLFAIGLGRRGIQVVHPGVDLEKLFTGPKSFSPTVLYLGRLKPYKSVDVLIRAFQQVVKMVENSQLIIAGAGDATASLKRLVHELGLGEVVQFLGRVSEAKKVTLLQQAWVLVNPSLIEGWGITSIEANACGTPIVASNVPGLRDSVQNPHTGFLVPYGDENAFAEKILQIIQNPTIRHELSQGAISWAQGFDWRLKSQEFFSILNEDNPGVPQSANVVSPSNV